jgi:hypothetical protein
MYLDDGDEALLQGSDGQNQLDGIAKCGIEQSAHSLARTQSKFLPGVTRMKDS